MYSYEIQETSLPIKYCKIPTLTFEAKGKMSEYQMKGFFIMAISPTGEYFEENGIYLTWIDAFKACVEKSKIDNNPSIAFLPKSA